MITVIREVIPNEPMDASTPPRVKTERMPGIILPDGLGAQLHPR
jgi:hypothetical protein